MPNLPASNSKRTQLLRLLAEGPATTSELAVESGWQENFIAANLSQHVKAGRVGRKPYPFSQNGKAWIWSVTEKGLRYLASMPPGALPGAASGPAPTS
jgi:DNA-binding HxlR family transcriptional regulator